VVKWHLLIWLFVLSAVAEQRAGAADVVHPSFTQQEIIPLAFQYRLELLETVEHSQDPGRTAASPVSEPISRPETASYLPPDPLYCQMSLQL